MNGKRFSNDKARKNGFYLALAVCLVAVGIAAWSTYDAVHSYVAPSRRETSSLAELQGEEIRGGEDGEDQPASGGEDDPQRPSPTAPARQTAGTVTVKPKPTAAPAPTAKPTAAPTVEPTEEPMVPANAPLYELSSEMVWPLNASQEVLKAYSSGTPVYSETMRDWRIHTGTDMAAEAGEEVWACANGQVRGTYSDAMLGNVIVIEHGDYTFSYCGVNEDFQVHEGDIVTKGQVIGSVTAVPCEAADQPHLHLEVRRDNAWLDPQSVIGGDQ